MRGFNFIEQAKERVSDYWSKEENREAVKWTAVLVGTATAAAGVSLYLYLMLTNRGTGAEDLDRYFPNERNRSEDNPNDGGALSETSLAEIQRKKRIQEITAEITASNQTIYSCLKPEMNDESFRVVVSDALELEFPEDITVEDLEVKTVAERVLALVSTAAPLKDVSSKWADKAVLLRNEQEKRQAANLKMFGSKNTTGIRVIPTNSKQTDSPKLKMADFFKKEFSELRSSVVSEVTTLRELLLKTIGESAEMSSICYLAVARAFSLEIAVPAKTDQSVKNNVCGYYEKALLACEEGPQNSTTTRQSYVEFLARMGDLEKAHIQSLPLQETEAAWIKLLEGIRDLSSDTIQEAAQLYIENPDSYFFPDREDKRASFVATAEKLLSSTQSDVTPSIGALYDNAAFTVSSLSPSP